jgi:hypothetical protein
MMSVIKSRHVGMLDGLHRGGPGSRQGAFAADAETMKTWRMPP